MLVSQTRNGSRELLIVYQMQYEDSCLHEGFSLGRYDAENDEEESAGEELEMIAVSRKPLRQLSCNQIERTNIEPGLYEIF